MNITLTITDVYPSDSGYYATVNGKDYNLSGEVEMPGCVCQQCGRAEQYDEETEEWKITLCGDQDVILCSECLKQAAAVTAKKPGPWAIYPEVMATSTREVADHAMIWFADFELAKKYALAESEHVGIRHDVYLANPPSVPFVEFMPGVMVKADDPVSSQKAIGRLRYLSGIIAAMKE